MSTPNFKTQEYFDLYVAIYEQPSDEDIKEWEEETECSYDFEFESNIYYEDVVTNFEFELKHVLNELGKQLKFHKLDLESGYYDGIQITVNVADELNSYIYEDTYEDMDNEDTKYLYDLTRSQFIKQYEIERRYIDRKVLPKLAERTGFRKIHCVGVFSNGEAIYRWAA